MADPKPDVLKRLEEIEASDSPSNGPQSCHLVKTADMRWLLKLTRALLESQGELLEQVRKVCPHTVSFGIQKSGCGVCKVITSAEKVRKGEV